MENRRLILISNDDGFDARGIIALTDGLRSLGDIVVVAPDGPRSGMGSAITCASPITYKLLEQEDGLKIYSCSGTPTDCVKLALSEMLDRSPDLIVSGINHGGNQAISVHYSGTMGAAFEGCVHDIPSIGVSLYNYSSKSDFSESVRFARLLSERVLKEGLPHGTYLNLNIPDTNHVKGIEICRQADGKWMKEYSSEQLENGEMQYWLQGEYLNYEPIHHNNDTRMLDEGYATIVPCKIDVTDYDYIEILNNWKF